MAVHFLAKVDKKHVLIHELRFIEFAQICISQICQWRNVGTVTTATPGGDKESGAINHPKMWDNFATLTARLAKSRVLVNNLVILRDFERNFRIKSRK